MGDGPAHMLLSSGMRTQQTADSPAACLPALPRAAHIRQWSVSKGFSSRIWPWDLKYGIPINCSL